tara:strand:+ start:4082 stop:4471 length:390 start_codon:yes stop_codon:yes gene_type:complete
MSYQERIIEVFEEEFKLRVDGMMTEFADIISKKHQISLDLLLRDIPLLSPTAVCRGTKPDGSRCTFKGIHDGYCGKHKRQGNRIKQRFHESHDGHNHGPGLSYVVGCQGCEKSFSSKQVIDLNSIMGNE